MEFPQTNFIQVKIYTVCPCQFHRNARDILPRPSPGKLLTCKLSVKTAKRDRERLYSGHGIVIIHRKHILRHAAKLHNDVLSCRGRIWRHTSEKVFWLLNTFRAETRTLIGGGGILIHSRSARRVQFFSNEIQIDQFEKKSVGQKMNIWTYTPPPPPPINVLFRPWIP